MMLSRKAFHDVLVSLMHLERRFEPFWRYRADALFREPIASMLQWLINLQRRDEGLHLAEEKLMPGEQEFLDSIIADMAAYMREKYQPGGYERAGNTKTHGLVRAEVTIRDDLPASFRHGVFSEPKTYRAWVRFS